MPDEHPEPTSERVCVCGHPWSEHNVWLKHYDVCYARGCKCQQFVTAEEEERMRLLHEKVDREIAARRAGGAA